MKWISNFWDKVKSIYKNNSKEFIVLGIFIVAFSAFLIGNAFAALTPTKSVIITSQKTSYEDKEPGSWQVEKSGKWISKGKARVTFDVDTTLMTEGKDTDIIFVLDISGSMSGDKLERVKHDSIELIDSLLSNKNNNAALITFDTGSTIVSDFTNDKDYLINEINNLEDTGSTNYYQPLVNVETILKDYVKTDDKEVIVLFLTDGYPNVDVPNQIAQYQTLKKNYPYITINGIQYEMGETILDPIKEISDNQFFADMETLNNVLFDASVTPIPYDEFQIVDYIDNDYFTLDSVDDITVSQGNVKLEEEKGKQKITWTIPHFKTGRTAKLTMDINLKGEYIGQGGIYPTNKSEEIISKIVDAPDEDVSSTKTPVLSDNYKVIYDGNSPDGSGVSNVPEEVNYSVFDTVSLTSEEPSCIGYEFKGWEIVNKKVTRVGEDYFIMPEEDVVIRARWSKIEVSKSMNGTVNNMGDSIMKGSSWFSNANIEKEEVTSIVTKDNLEIPTSAIEYWDASEAEDGSVIAYAEDDGSGNGTYKVTIAGQGGIIANPDSSYLFYGRSSIDGFASLESVDLTYLDTSLVTDMSYMFNYCISLTNLNISSFDTSNVTDMRSMFAFSGIVTVDLSSFNTSKLRYLGGTRTSDNTGSYGMFANCENLISVDLSNFDTSNVVSLNSLFYGCDNLTSVIFGENFVTSKVTNMALMFMFCENLQDLNLSGFDTSKVTDMNHMFCNCFSIANLDIYHFNTANVINMEYMFSDCNTITSLNLSSWDTSNVTSMYGMFRGCENLVNLNITGFNTRKVTDMSYMFQYDSHLSYVDVSSFNTERVIDMAGMFYSCGDLYGIDVSKWHAPKVTDTHNMFSGCHNLTYLNLKNWETSSLDTMYEMFYGCSSLIELDVSGLNTSKVDSMDGLFYDCENIISLDLSNWDTSNVVTMGHFNGWGMFSGCRSLTTLNLSNFDTSKVEDVRSMFESCSNLVFLDLSNADFNSVVDFSSMFYSINSKVNVIVKDSAAESFIRARLDEAGRTNATVTIANPATQTSLFELGPREFGPFFFVVFFLCLLYNIE